MMDEESSNITIAVIGHEGSGKSTTTGHLIFELGGIDKSLMGRYEEETAAMSNRPSTYRWLLDTLKANKECVKFKSRKYDCTVVDSLDYSDFRQAITNTYQADCAILMTDSTAEIGMDYLTLMYAKYLRKLGVKQIICCCNKMDATTPKYSMESYERIVKKVSMYFKMIGYDTDKVKFIPISGLEGDNIIKKSSNLEWYKGLTLLETFDTLSVPKYASDKLSDPQLQEMLTEFDNTCVRHLEEKNKAPQVETNPLKPIFGYPPVPMWPKMLF